MTILAALVTRKWNSGIASGIVLLICLAIDCITIAAITGYIVSQ